MSDAAWERFLEGSWERFVEEGEYTFAAMVKNFEDMLDGETTIKHFSFRMGDLCDMESYEVETHSAAEVQREMAAWIRKEKDEGHLFDPALWKPFRDKSMLTVAYLGYRRLFQHKDHYWQLSIESECEIHQCKYCKASGTCFGEHFATKLYAWKEEGVCTLQPYNHLTALPDGLMPDGDWERK